jgi:uncharacterized protein
VIGPSIVTLILGILLGYLAQRSRICFIGGLRDFILVRDTELLKGVLAFFVTAWLAFSVAGAFGLIDGIKPRWRLWQPAAAASTPATAAALPAVVAGSNLPGVDAPARSAHSAPGAKAGLAAPAPADPASPPATEPAGLSLQLGRAFGGINWRLWALTLAGGLLLGLCSTLANGCPTRQHVLAAQGMRDSRFYLIGFYGGIILFYLLIKPFLATLL